MASASWHGYRFNGYLVHGIGIMAMGIEHHQNRTPHMGISCMDACHGIGIWFVGISPMSIGNSHHRTRKRHQHRRHHAWYQLHGHGYRVPPEQDATHGMGISPIDACHLQRMPDTWHGYLVHGIGCMSIVFCMAIGCNKVQ